MSPEKTPFTASTPDKPAAAPRELIEMPDWGTPKPESEPLKEPLKTATELVSEAEDLDPTARLELMKAYVASIEALALSGDIKSGNGNGRPYSLEEVQRQMNEFVQELNSSTMSRTDRKNLIPRAGDLNLRESFEDLINDEATATTLMEAITMAARETARKNEIATERIEPARSLGGNTLDLLGIADPAEKVADPLAELTRNLDASDIQSLRSYAEALQSKRDAQKSGNGENSTYWGQIAGQTWREMKPQIQAIAGRYESLYRRF